MQRETVNERSPCRLRVIWEVEGAVALPLSVTYRVDDVFSGTTIAENMPASPGLETIITITPTENAMVDPSNPVETRRVTWTINAGELGETNGDMLYDVRNLVRVA